MLRPISATTMRPLISERTYARFIELKEQLAIQQAADLAPVFIPVGSIKKANRPIRLLFVGQATNGALLDDDTIFADAAEEYARQARAWVISDNGFWWPTIRKLCKLILDGAGINSHTHDLASVVGGPTSQRLG